METKKRFIECLLPSSYCNLKCEYCYVIQQNRRKGIIEKPDYPIDIMIKGLSKKRLGGSCFFSICAIGETLIPNYLFAFVEGLLKEGHFVNITNNGTATNRITEYCSLPYNLTKRLHFSFSFHYNELKKHNLLDVFFNNVIAVRNAGCSFIVKLNLCDSYIKEIEEIKKICLDKIGSLPVISITRKQENKVYDLFTGNVNKYIQTGNEMHSKMFELTTYFFRRRINDFCYAGDWSLLLNLKTGIMSKCYSNSEGSQDVFKDISKPIKFQAVGKHCKSEFCVNADHFLTQGVVPTIKCDGYAEIRTDGERNWYQNDFYFFSNQKLYVGNNQYCILRKLKTNAYYLIERIKHHN